VKSFVSFSRDSLIAAYKSTGDQILSKAANLFRRRNKAVDYMQNAFKKLGLEPGNGDSYVQDVPLVEITPCA
jgi:hypothetical protein